MSGPWSRNETPRKPAAPKAPNKKAGVRGGRTKLTTFDWATIISIPAVITYLLHDAGADQLLDSIFLGALTMWITYRLFKDRLQGLDNSRVNDSFGFISFCFLITMVFGSTWAAIISSVTQNEMGILFANSFLLILLTLLNFTRIAVAGKRPDLWASGAALLGGTAGLLPEIMVPAGAQMIANNLACFSYAAFFCLILMAKAPTTPPGAHS